jgi:hypothetical protein
MGVLIENVSPVGHEIWSRRFPAPPIIVFARNRFAVTGYADHAMI